MDWGGVACHVGAGDDYLVVVIFAVVDIGIPVGEFLRPGMVIYLSDFGSARLIGPQYQVACRIVVVSRRPDELNRVIE